MAAEGPVVTESRSQFSPDYAREEIYEIAAELMAKGGIPPLQSGKPTLTLPGRSDG